MSTGTLIAQQRRLSCNEHIDWPLKGWRHRFNVYAPPRFLIGQRRSKSDIIAG